MTTSVDTNVFVSLWSGTDEAAQAAQASLERASRQGTIIIAPVVYAELVAGPRRDPDTINIFLQRARIGIDWNLDKAVWQIAALAFQGYAERRRASAGDSGPRRILADFMIGAHAVHVGATLLTWDDRIYRAAFPSLTILVPMD